MHKKNMRITGGFLVRRLFLLPKEIDENLVRPTPDRVRESLFSLLLPYLQDKTVLDLFSGSGSHAFESISRGAKMVTLVEKNKNIKNLLELNINNLQLNDKCNIVLSDAIDFVKNQNSVYDVIFLDPPYALSLPLDFFEKLKKLLAKNGILIYRCFKKNPVAFNEDWLVIKEKVYGSMRVFLLAVKGACNEHK